MVPLYVVGSRNTAWMLGLKVNAFYIKLCILVNDILPYTEGIFTLGDLKNLARERLYSQCLYKDFITYLDSTLAVCIRNNMIKVL